MARYCAQNQISEPIEIKQSNLGGYQYNPKASTEVEWVFQRKLTD